MTTVDSVVGASQGTYVASSTPTRAPKQTMDSEVFMSLLVAQLRNQDPSSPMDTNQMISQTTQLAMMEKMNELAVTGQEDFSLQMRIAAAAFVGKDVSYTDATGATITGVARSVSFAGPVPMVTIDGMEIPLDLISGITATSAP
ncbi:flagellar hook assembly protein FlgD [Homoserinimonas sp. A520]